MDRIAENLHQTFSKVLFAIGCREDMPDQEILSQKTTQAEEETNSVDPIPEAVCLPPFSPPKRKT